VNRVVSKLTGTDLCVTSRKHKLLLTSFFTRICGHAGVTTPDNSEENRDIYYISFHIVKFFLFLVYSLTVLHVIE
jgi:hypothetical protein